MLTVQNRQTALKFTDEDRVQRLEVLRRIAAARGSECLASHYTDNRTKLAWRCALGHEWNAIPLNVARGHWCIICGNERQGRAKAHSIEMMRKIAASRSGQCLSTSYKNNFTRLRWRCARGHEWNAVPGSVVGSGKRKGSWCPICVGKLPKAIALENLKQLAITRSGALLSSCYRDARTALRWKCAKGHEWRAVPAAVKHGTWCPVCGGSFPSRWPKCKILRAIVEVNVSRRNTSTAKLIFDGNARLDMSGLPNPIIFLRAIGVRFVPAEYLKESAARC